MNCSPGLLLSVSKRALFFQGVLSVALMVFAISTANAAFTVDITNCTPSVSVNNITLNNLSGTEDIQVRKITAVLRAFPKPGMPGDDCPDVSFWDTRMNLPIMSGATSEEDLEDLLPDNFGSGITWPATACKHYILSVAVDYTEVSAPTVLKEIIASCKYPATTPFPEPLISTSGQPQFFQRVQHDLVAATGIQPNGGGGGGEPHACFTKADVSNTMLHNQSPNLTYQGIYAGQFVCKKTNDAIISNDEVCITGAPTSSTTGRGLRGSFKGFRLPPDECGGFRINTVTGFPKCCDCTSSSPPGCGSPIVMQCGRVVATGELDPATGVFSYYDPAIFLTRHRDVEVRTETDIGGGGGANPNQNNLVIDCLDLAYSDFNIFTDIWTPLNFDRFTFDEQVEDPDANKFFCDDRQTAGLGKVTDRDLNGIVDECQFIVNTTPGGVADRPGQHNFAGNLETSVRKRIRNMYYDGTDANTTAPPSFLVMEELTFAGEVLPLDPNNVDLSSNAYDEIYTFSTPDGLMVPGDHNMTFTDTDPDPTESFTSSETFHAADWLIAGSVIDLVGSSLLGFDLENRRQVDLIGPEDNTVMPVIPQLPLRGLGFSPFGKRFYAAINKQVLVYDAISRVQLDLGNPGTPEKEGRNIGEPVYGVAVESEGRYAFAIAGSVDIYPGEGWIAILDSATGHMLVQDPGDSDSFFADIPGTPIDLEVRNIDDPVDPGKEAIIYTTSVQLLSGECPSGAGMAMGAMEEPLVPIVPLPGGGGCCGGNNHRVVLLSAIDMDRPNGFAGASRTGSVEISCVTVAGTADLLEHVGLDIAADGRIFVVSEDSGMLTTVATDAAGLLVPSSLISVPVIGMQGRPKDVAVGRNRNGVEIALVVGTDDSDGHGRAHFMDATSLVTTVIRDLFLDSDPVATVIRFDGRFAYVAQRGTSEIQVLNLDSEAISPPPIPVAGSLNKLAIQRQDP